MPTKGPVRAEYVQAFKEGRVTDIPEHLRSLVEDVVNRSAEQEVTQDQHDDLPKDGPPVEPHEADA